MLWITQICSTNRAVVPVTARIPHPKMYTMERDMQKGKHLVLLLEFLI